MEFGSWGGGVESVESVEFVSSYCGFLSYVNVNFEFIVVVYSEYFVGKFDRYGLSNVRVRKNVLGWAVFAVKVGDL